MSELEMSLEMFENWPRKNMTQFQNIPCKNSKL